MPCRARHGRKRKKKLLVLFLFLFLVLLVSQIREPYVHLEDDGTVLVDKIENIGTVVTAMMVQGVVEGVQVERLSSKQEGILGFEIRISTSFLLAAFSSPCNPCILQWYLTGPTTDSGREIVQDPENIRLNLTRSNLLLLSGFYRMRIILENPKGNQERPLLKRDSEFVFFEQLKPLEISNRNCRSSSSDDDNRWREVFQWQEVFHGRWIKKSVAEEKGLSPDNALMVPAERIEKKGSCTELFNSVETGNHLALKQDYIYVPLNCKLGWMRKKRFLTLMLKKLQLRQGDDDEKKVEKFHVQFMGSSRIRNLYRDFLQFLNFSQDLLAKRTLKVKYHSIGWRTSNLEKNIEIINKTLPTLPFCENKQQGSKNGKLVFSTGIWEAFYGFRKNKSSVIVDPFENSDDDVFVKYMRAIAEMVLLHCAKERVIFVTEPMVHSNSSISFKPSENGFGKIKGRMMRLNFELRRVAKRNGVLLLDNERLTMSRVDAMKDKKHYVCGDCNRVNCPKTGGMGSALMQTSVQILLRQILS